jgi:hypothetical protein
VTKHSMGHRKLPSTFDLSGLRGMPTVRRAIPTGLGDQYRSGVGLAAALSAGTAAVSLSAPMFPASGVGRRSHPGARGQRQSGAPIVPPRFTGSSSGHDDAHFEALAASPRPEPEIVVPFERRKTAEPPAEHGFTWSGRRNSNPRPSDYEITETCPGCPPGPLSPVAYAIQCS